MSKPAFTTAHGEKFTLERVRGLVVSTRIPIDDETLKDVVQEAALAIWRHPNPANPWMIARAAAIDYLRRNGTLTRRGGKPIETRMTLSLDAPVRPHSTITIADTIADTRPSVEEAAFQETLADLLAPLNKRERYIVVATSLGVDGITVGATFGISDSRVSQIRHVALDKIARRHELGATA